MHLEPVEAEQLVVFENGAFLESFWLGTNVAREHLALYRVSFRLEAFLERDDVDHGIVRARLCPSPECQSLRDLSSDSLALAKALVNLTVAFHNVDVVVKQFWRDTLCLL